MKITFMGAGSTVFAKNVLGDILLCSDMPDLEFALYDISSSRLADSQLMIEALNQSLGGGKAKIQVYCGVENRKEALRGAAFVINAINVGGYEPCTVTDFEIPKKYGLRQTIGDTLGIGGIFRALRTIPVLSDFARDMEDVCPDAFFLNYTNPMAMITGYLQRYTQIKSVGLCHSVQVCAQRLLEGTGMEEYIGKTVETIAGINHMAWLLELKDREGNDLYPLLRRLAKERNAREKHKDMVRFDYVDKFGYYCTESSEHNAEYSALYIKPGREDIIDHFNIPLDEYLSRCTRQIRTWEERREQLLKGEGISHERSREYASRIIEAFVTDKPYRFGGNVINHGVIPNLPDQACVEVPCIMDAAGIHPVYVGELPLQLAAMNSLNIYPQLLTIEAAHTKKKEYIYQAAMMDPHTAETLSTDEIVSLCDDLIKAHGDWLPKYN